MKEASTNGFFPSVSACHFSFFEAGKQARVKPRYLLYPNVRLSDLQISLRVLRKGGKEERARQANFNKGQLTPFGIRQLSFRHYITRFKQPNGLIKEAIEGLEAERKKEGIKAILRRIDALSRGRITLEEKEELTQLRVKLSPSYGQKVREKQQRERAAFKKIWKGIKASSIGSELNNNKDN